jgi:tetratricopeptide (TPR) repeat protein
MKDKEKIKRETVIQTLVNALRPLSYVYAFYEGGAAAFGRVDEWSDIDLYLIVEDTKVDEAFLTVEEVLKSISFIKQKYEVTQLPWPGVAQAFYRLESTSEYLIIDLAILNLNSPEKFLQSEIHGNVVFYFSKLDKISIPSFDRDAFAEKISERLKRLQSRFDMFNNFVQKEINRGNFLEALDLYYTLVLTSLVEVLRIKHNPMHYDFRMRYVHYELPDEVVAELERLYFVKNAEELQAKYLEAAEWFRKAMLEVDRKKIVEQLMKEG